MSLTENLQDNITSWKFSFQENENGFYENEQRYSKFIGSEALVSNSLLKIMRYVIDAWLCSIIGVVGIIDNIIAMLVFSKQGFKETINISLINIALWDLIKCVCGCMYRLHDVIKLISPSYGLIWQYISGVVTMYLFFISGYVSCVLAGYVAFERCLCVSKPFDVRFLLTPTITISVNVALSFIVFASLVINYSQYKIVWMFDGEFNRTIPERVRSSLYHPEITRYYNVISITLPMFSFVVICACTGIIFYGLRKSSKFKATMATGQDKRGNSSNVTDLSTRDRRIIKILLVILVVYIVNLLPRLIRYFLKLIFPEFRMMGHYSNIFHIVSYIMFLFDLINAAVNPFIFFFMSSQFRETFLKIFCFTNKNSKAF